MNKIYYFNNECSEFIYQSKKDLISNILIWLISSLLIILYGNTSFIGGVNVIKLIFVFIIPLIVVFFIFFFMPIVVKGAKINRIIKQIKIDNDNIQFQSFSWMFYRSITINTKLENLGVNKTSVMSIVN